MPPRKTQKSKKISESSAAVKVKAVDGVIPDLALMQINLEKEGDEECDEEMEKGQGGYEMNVFYPNGIKDGHGIIRDRYELKFPVYYEYDENWKKVPKKGHKIMIEYPDWQNIKTDKTPNDDDPCGIVCWSNDITVIDLDVLKTEEEKAKYPDDTKYGVFYISIKV